MTAFEFYETTITGLMEISPFIASDQRGYLSKVYEKNIFSSHGIEMQPFEELTALSKKGTIRGLHFQHNYSQDKLVRVICGAVYDVALDLRHDSATFGKWQSFYLSSEKKNMLYIPKGFAHGYLALEEDTLFSYLCGDRYDPASDDGISWDDSQLAIDWPLHLVQDICISDKDKTLPTFSEFKSKYGSLKG